MGANADFVARVSKLVKRGDVHDAEIPSAIKDAVRNLEQEHTWSFMYLESLGEVLAQGFNAITLLQDPKSIRFIRFYRPEDQSLGATGAADRFIYASKVQSEDVRRIKTATEPRNVLWYQQDKNTIVLNTVFDQDEPYDLAGYFWSDSTSDDLPWLEYNQGLLLRATIIELADFLRDDKVLARAENYIKTNLPRAIEADTDFKHDGEDMVMSPFTREIQDDFFSSSGSDRT